VFMKQTLMGFSIMHVYEADVVMGTQQ